MEDVSLRSLNLSPQSAYGYSDEHSTFRRTTNFDQFSSSLPSYDSSLVRSKQNTLSTAPRDTPSTAPRDTLFTAPIKQNQSLNLMGCECNNGKPYTVTLSDIDRAFHEKDVSGLTSITSASSASLYPSAPCHHKTNVMEAFHTVLHNDNEEAVKYGVTRLEALLVPSTMTREQSSLNDEEFALKLSGLSLEQVKGDSTQDNSIINSFGFDVRWDLADKMLTDARDAIDQCRSGSEPSYRVQFYYLTAQRYAPGTEGSEKKINGRLVTFLKVNLSSSSTAINTEQLKKESVNLSPQLVMVISQSGKAPENIRGGVQSYA